MTRSHPPGGDTAPEAPEGLTRVVVRGVGLAGSGYLLTQLLTVISYLVLARLITPTEMGEFAAGSLVMIAALFAESGMLAALIQRPDRIEEAAATAVIATMAAGVAFAVAGLAASPLIGLFFDSRESGSLRRRCRPGSSSDRPRSCRKRYFSDGSRSCGGSSRSRPRSSPSA